VVINRLTTFVALPPDSIERLDRGWVARLMRPIFLRRASARRVRQPPFAVVARGIAAQRVEREAADLLVDEGFNRSAAEGALTHLASPALDPIESALVPFVRETIWYEPAPLQRRARALRGPLTDEQLLETIGIAACANAVCRLSRAFEAIG
jgi:hypothetical protein